MKPDDGLSTQKVFDLADTMELDHGNGDAVEEAFGVEVEKVNVINFDGKVKRQGKFVGKTSAYKKAIVTLTKSSKTIEFFEGL